MKAFFAKLMRIDRRWIFLAMGLVVGGALLSSIVFPTLEISPDVRTAYDLIDRLPAGSAVLYAWDYDPGSQPELYPLSGAMLRHAMRKDLKVVMMGHWPNGIPLIERQIDEVIKRDFPQKRYGVDYANLGYKSGQNVVVITMAKSIKDAFPTDYYQTPVDSLPLLREVRSLRDCKAIVSFSAGDPGLTMWIQFAWQRFHIPVTGGCTAVSAPEFAAYLQSGQLKGLMGGMRGAAEYEVLVGRQGLASIGMTAQSLAHALIVLFIVIGNVAYFAAGRRKEGQP
ncbi:MAG TPA: hypothetical protein VMF29_04420 [Candidatus Edwardsbacteria bacterium]|nr:hypothetical protein [Candidatus Edwardsbacteria bacterium]